MDRTKDMIIELLAGTGREGILTLIEYLTRNGFFESPASSRFHGVYPGGLAEHSLNVYKRLAELNISLQLGVKFESIIIAALLHDVCKVGAYLKKGIGYTRNPEREKGHAILSIERIKKYIELTKLEEMMIRYHMGVYGLNECDEQKGEYTLRNRSMIYAWHHHPIVKVMYFCDEIETLSERMITENNNDGNRNMQSGPGEDRRGRGPRVRNGRDRRYQRVRQDIGAV